MSIFIRFYILLSQTLNCIQFNLFNQATGSHDSSRWPFDSNCSDIVMFDNDGVVRLTLQKFCGGNIMSFGTSNSIEALNYVKLELWSRVE